MSRLIDQDRLLILSYPNKILFYEVDKITALRHDARDNDVAIVYDNDTNYFQHPEGSAFFYEHLKSIVIDLKTRKQTSVIVEIQEG